MRSWIGHMATFCSNQHNITQLNSCYIILSSEWRVWKQYKRV